MKFVKRILFLCGFFAIANFASAQPGYRVFDFVDPSLKAFSVTSQIGISSYFGDLCATNDCYTKNKPSVGAGVSLRLNDYFFFNFNALYYRIEGSDAESGNLGRIRRNLSFRADNYEFSLVGNFEFLNYNTFRYLTRKEFPVSAFAFLGIGLTTNNPSTFYQGRYVSLRPLKTELVDYSPVSAVLPFGLGVGYRFNEYFAVNFTMGYRYSFTDYLDDVSTSYQGSEAFSNDLARELQFRSDELPPQILGGRKYGKEGDYRGNPQSNDGYLILALRAEFKIPKIDLNFFGAGKSGNFGAPKSGGSQPVRRSARRRS